MIDGVRGYVDDTLVADGWSDHATATAVTGSFANTAASGWHRT